MQSGNGTSGSDLFTGYEPSMSVGVVPPGSRLAQYLHPSRPSPWNSQSQGASSSYPIANPSSPLSASNVPSFVPSFAQVGLGDDKDVNVPISVGPYSMPSSSQRSLNYGSMIPMHMRQDGHMLSETGNSVPPNYMQEKFGGTTYFFQPNQNTIENCRSDSQNGRILVCGSGNFAYQGPPPHIGKFRPKSGILSYFSSPDLRLELLQRQLAVQCRADPSMFRDIPQNVEHFRNLVPLENMKISGLNHLERTVLGTSMTIVYKAISIRDGMPYCIRRVLNVRLGSPKQLALADNWKKLLHANVVQLRDVIQTRAFNDNSLLFIYDYHPLSETLKYRHLNNGRMNGMSSTFMEGTGGVQEHLLWAYIVQLSSALRAIHASGMAARTVDPTKIIVFSKTKLMLSSCGILDVIAPENGHSSLQHQQQEDLSGLGRVIVALAMGSMLAVRPENLSNSVQMISKHYSTDMKNVITLLLSPPQPGRNRSINEIMPMIGARFYAQLENAQMKNDLLENELSKELENGRLFRLLCKLNTIIERPDFQLDMQWSETGDRYLLKLFRDYLFHQVNENGKPWIDMAHIITCLNKLDAGTAEKIQLVSRDGENVLIVSFADLRQCIENAFSELTMPGPSGTVVPSLNAPMLPMVPR